MTPEQYTFNSNPNPDAQFAYLLQHSQPGDPQVLDLLLERQGPDLFRLVGALLAMRQTGQAAPDEAEVLARTARVLRQAVSQLDQFWGEVSVSAWLYGLALDEIYGRLGRRRLRAAFQGTPRTTPHRPARSAASGKPPLRAALEQLPAGARLATLLRYGHGQTVEAIAQLLQVAPGQVHGQLVQARARLAAAEGQADAPACAGWTYDDSRPRARLEQGLDGLLEADPYARHAFQTHLEECPGCRQAWREGQALEKTLQAALEKTWPGPNATQRQRLATLARQPAPAGAAGWTRLPWRQLSLAALLVVAVAAVGLVFNRATIEAPGPTSEANLAMLATAQSLSARSEPQAEPSALPTPLAPPSTRRPERLSTFAGPNLVWSSQPALSGNGRSLAFASLASYWTPGDVNGVADVFLYDLDTGAVSRISQTAAGRGGEQASYLPAVSYDGQVVAYYSGAQNLLPEDSGPPACAELPGSPGFPYNCGDILLYERSTGETIRVTRPPEDGQSAAAEHQAPALSANGRYVAFLSTARDFAGLAEGAPSACPPASAPEGAEASDGAGAPCAELYVYDREAGTKSRIPLGRQLGEMGFSGLERQTEPSISSDGRYVALTLLPIDAANPRLGQQVAALFDRQTGTWTALDEQAGRPAPDGDSFNPVIAADQGTAAFVSEASNLTAGDDNAAADVFVRDLASGLVTRVSVDSQGAGGDGPSGVFVADNNQQREKLTISADGRYVAFVSAAGNLAPELRQEDLCWTWEYGSLCAALYLHDRLTGETRLVAEPQKQLIFHQPSLSGDGQRLAYSDDRLGCRGAYPYQICADLWLYELASGETRPLSTQFASQLEQGEAQAALDTAQEQAEGLQAALAVSAAPVQPDDLPSLSAEHVVELPEAHRRRLRTLDVSPDGALLATGSDDDDVILWETATLQPIDRLESHRTRVTAVRFSADGGWLATGSADGVIHVWRVDAFARETPQRAFTTLRSRRIGGIEALAFSIEDRWLAVGSRFGLWIFEREGRTFNLREDLSRADLNVRALDFTARDARVTGPLSGTLLATGLADGSTLLYSLPSGRVLGRLGGQDEPVLAVRFDPSGKYLATGGQSNVVDLWEVNLPRRQPLAYHLFRIEHQDWVTDLAFSPSGGTLISTSYDDTLRYTDARTGEQQQVTLNPEWRDFLTARPAPDGTRLYAGRSSGSLMVFERPHTNEPEFFQQINVTELSSPPPSGLPENLGLGEYPPVMHPENPAVRKTFSFTLDDLAGRGLLAPTRLPDGLAFLGAHVREESGGETLLYYTRVVENSYRGAVLLRQGAHQGADFFAPAIPTEALVEPLEFTFLPALEVDLSGEPARGSLVYAELVRGGWESTPQGFASWNAQLPIQRLHWAAGGQAYSLEFFDFPPHETGNLSQEALIDLAASMRPIDQVLAQQPVDLPYRMPANQTCTGLAAQLGVEVTGLVRTNRQHGLDLLQDGCETLEAGQQIYLPLQPSAYQTLNLDCDGSQERLRLLRDPRGALLGFTLQARQPNGFYSDYALVRVEDNLSQVMQPPVVHRRPSSCEWFVAVQVDSRESLAPLTRLLRWHDGHLQLVLAAPGVLTGLVQEGFQLLAETQAVVTEAEQGCQLERARHAWDGTAFVPRERLPGELLACPAPGETLATPGSPAVALPAGELPGGELPEDFRLQMVSDLDCDRTEEYLLLQAAPATDPVRLLGLAVAQPGPTGALALVERLEAAALGGATVGVPAVYKGGRASYSAPGQGESCWFALAVEVWATAEAAAPDKVVVLGWDGSGLKTLAELPGGLANLQWRPAEAGQPTGILNREYGRLAGGECQPAQVLYWWDGESFERALPQGREWQRCEPGESEMGGR